MCSRLGEWSEKSYIKLTSISAVAGLGDRAELDKNRSEVWLWLALSLLFPSGVWVCGCVGVCGFEKLSLKLT